MKKDFMKMIVHPLDDVLEKSADLMDKFNFKKSAQHLRDIININS